MATIPMTVDRKPSSQILGPNPHTEAEVVGIDAPVSYSQPEVRRHTVANTGNRTGTHQAAPGLPPGWIELKDPDGKVIFYNTVSRLTSWRRPMIRTLPPGWQKTQTSDGRTVYICAENGTASYEWPSLATGKIAPPDGAALTRVVSEPQGLTVNPTPTDKKPLPRTRMAPAARSQSSPIVSVNIDMDAMRVVPGVEHAYAVHQLSTNNNTEVLSKKLATDISQTTVALRDTSITAASLVTRQAKAVGKTMVSPKRMQKVSKKMVVHTGAMTVQAARACKVLASDMVDAADKKGKYQPKEPRQFVPYHGNAPVESHTPDDQYKDQQSQAGVAVDALSHPSQSSNAQGMGIHPQPGPMSSIYANANVGLSINAAIPARKPVRKPVPKPALSEPGTGVANNALSASLSATANLASHTTYNSTTNPTGTVEKPPTQSTAAEIAVSQELHNLLAQQQSTSHVSIPQKPSQQAVSSMQPNLKPHHNSLQVQVQGQLQATATLGIQPVGSAQHLHLTPNVRPQIQSVLSPTPTSPPPSYSQVVRPSPARPPIARPVQRPPLNNVPPQTIQQSPHPPSGSTQDSDVVLMTQTMDQLHLPDSQSAYNANLGLGQTNLSSHAVTQEHSAYQEHQAFNNITAVQQNQTIIEQQQVVYQNNVSQPDQTIITQQVVSQGATLPQNQDHLIQQNQAVSMEASFPENQCLVQQQQFVSQDQAQQPQQQFLGQSVSVQQSQSVYQQQPTCNQSSFAYEQQAFVDANAAYYHDSYAMAGFTDYSGSTGTMCDAYAHESATMPTAESNAIVYEEVYFEGDDVGVTHQETVYVEGEGGVAYEDDGEYECTYE